MSIPETILATLRPVPSDIMRKAGRVVDEWQRRPVSICADQFETLRQEIALSILAERERAAGIADETQDDCVRVVRESRGNPNKAQRFAARALTARSIAADIREGGD